MYILNSETSFPYLHNHIQAYDGLKIDCNVGTEEQALKEAFEVISCKIREGMPIKPDPSQESLFPEDKQTTIDYLKKIRDRILSLKLVLIQLDSEEDAYLIFETLNARGRDLTTPDLVKNHLLQKLKLNNTQLDTAKEIWNSIIKKFDDAGVKNGMDSFLYHYWLSCKSYTTDKNLFSLLKKSAPDKKECESLLKDLQVNADYYLRLISPSTCIWTPEESNLKESLLAINSFDIKQYLSMGLSLMRAYKTKKITQRIATQSFEKMEFFHFVFNAVTSQRSSGSIATNYSRHAIEISNATSHDDIQKTLRSLFSELNRRLPNQEEFKANFRELIYTSSITRDRGIIFYILRKYLGRNSNGLSIDFSAMSIEHILPQSKNKFDEKQIKLIGSIGNLILVDKITNSEDLSNLDFPQKKSLLQDKGYPLDSAVINSEEWNELTINSRTEIISDDVYKKNPLK